jgi:site-specific recombinase XerD
MRMKSDSGADPYAWTISGKALAELLLATREAFMRVPPLAQLSSDYQKQARYIIEEYAHFCEAQEAAHPWLLRQSYLAHRAALRSERPYSASFVEGYGCQLRHFLRWYHRQLGAKKVSLGELSPAQLRAYWRTQPGARPYRHQVLSTHLRSLLTWLRRRPDAELSGELGVQLGDYFEQRHLALRGQGYGEVLSQRAELVTRRHLIWLERQSHLPAGTAVLDVDNGLRSERIEESPQALLSYFVAKVDPGLAEGLRQPLLEYLAQLVHERGLVKGSIQASLRTNWALCRQLANEGQDCFLGLRAAQLDRLVGALLSAPCEDLLCRRQQVQAHHSQLRGFLRYLHGRGLLHRDLGSVLLSPPCYGARKPPTVWSQEQVRSLLGSVSRDDARGRRCYAILLLTTTYGLRPVDVAQLRLDDLRWRQEQLALVQHKTGRMLTLPLLPEVVAGLYDYLRQDRVPGLVHRRVFVSLHWPHQPLRPTRISAIVVGAFREAGLGSGCARHLRATVATHLLRQGEPLSTIQEVLGHDAGETTQRYALVDVELLRQVLEESEQ